MIGQFFLLIILYALSILRLEDKMLVAMASSLSEKSLKVFLPSKSICLINTNVHLSPIISSAEVIGQLHLNVFFMLQYYE